MNLKDLVRAYVQQRTVLLVDGRHFEAGKEFAALRRQPSSEAIVNTVDALDYALGLLNQKDAEIARLNTELEQVDTVVAGAPTVKRDDLLTIAQSVVDAHAATTHAIIAPSAEAFLKVVLDREALRDATIYQLRQAIDKERSKP